MSILVYFSVMAGVYISEINNTSSYFCNETVTINDKSCYMNVSAIVNNSIIVCTQACAKECSLYSCRDKIMYPCYEEGDCFVDEGSFLIIHLLE